MTDTSHRHSRAFDDALQYAGQALHAKDPVQALVRVLMTFRDEYRAEVLAEVAAPAVVEPPTDQTALHRIAEAALGAVEAALGDILLPAAREEALAGIVAVLPPADRTPTIPPQADTAAGDESPHVYMDAVQDSAAWAHAFTKAGQMMEALEHVEAIERLLAVYRRAVGVETKTTTATADPDPLDVLHCLADPEPCRWEGTYCITHSWKSDIGRCPHGQAQALLGGGR